MGSCARGTRVELFTRDRKCLRGLGQVEEAMCRGEVWAVRGPQTCSPGEEPGALGDGKDLSPGLEGLAVEHLCQGPDSNGQTTMPGECGAMK